MRASTLVLYNEVEQLQHAVDVAVHRLRKEIQLRRAHLVDRVRNAISQRGKEDTYYWYCTLALDEGRSMAMVSISRRKARKSLTLSQSSIRFRMKPSCGSTSSYTSHMRIESTAISPEMGLFSVPLSFCR